MVMMGWVTLAPGTLADKRGRTLARMMGAAPVQFHPCTGTRVQHCGPPSARLTPDSRLNTVAAACSPRCRPTLATPENRVARTVLPLLRTTLLSAAIACAVALPIAAQNNRLPDIGSSAGEV